MQSFTDPTQFLLLMVITPLLTVFSDRQVVANLSYGTRERVTLNSYNPLFTNHFKAQRVTAALWACLASQ